MIKINFRKIIGKPDYSDELSEEMLQELNALINETKKNIKNVNEKLIRKAFYICVKSHEDQLLFSGQPYYKHPLDVAMIVSREIQLDDISVVCALLHATPSRGDAFNIEFIRAEFGEDIAQIVDGVRKIKYVETRSIQDLIHLENYRRLLLSMFDDVRIILIKLAERLNNMRTLDYLTEEKQLRSASETMEVYVPFAGRFGLANIKWELEDLAFKYTNKEAYQEIKNALNETRQEREQYVVNFSAPIKERLENDPFLKKNGVKFEISGRAKHIYSIYNKRILRQKNIDELYDLVAVRVIVEQDDPLICFYIYGIIASIYPPVPETFKDYISAPKQNGYQSIHVAVMGPKRKPAEVQIRTRKMHEISEQGFAAHFNYKSGLVPASSVMNNPNVQEWMFTVREILENESNETPHQLLESIKQNMFLDEIHVFSPKNQLMTFPKGATPLDFAFAVHTELGARTIGCKVNGKITPIDYKMQSGDQIEILSSKQYAIKKEWLKLVFTSRSKAVITRFLKNSEKENTKKGEKIWKEALKSNSIPEDKKILEQFAESIGFASINEFYVGIIEDSTLIDTALNFFSFHKVWKTPNANNLQPESIRKRMEAKEEAKYFNSEIIIRGEAGKKLINDITNNIIALDDISLYGVSFSEDEDGLKAKFNIILAEENDLEKICEEIRHINGVLYAGHSEN